MRGLVQYVRQFVDAPDALRASLASPTLVWESQSENEDQMLLATGAMGSAKKPGAGEPVVFEVRKLDSPTNAFPMGITVGRTENNDLAIDDNSISRFHAFFKLGSDGLWQLTDAESKNGTAINAQALVANTASPLHDGDRVRFGHVNTRFFLPEGFLGYLKATIKK